MSICANSQTYKALNDWFSEAYTTYPNLPEGILEAVSYNMTRLNHHLPDESALSCTGMPQTYGIMGLYLDGKGNFSNTLLEVSKVSGFSADELIESPRKNIIGTARWLSVKLKNVSAKKAENDALLEIMKDASGLPDNSPSDKHVRDIFAFQIVNDLQKGITRDGKSIVPANKKFNPSNYFSDEKLKKLNAGYIDMSEIEGDNSYKNSSTDYGPALWDEACDQSSRNGSAITHVTIHTAQGYYAGTISWFNNCSSNASAHYVIRSSDGQITQMVREYRKAWHVGSGNSYSIGIEHEGFINDGSWYTNQMYQSSANLVKDIANSSGYNIPTTSCYNGSSNSNSQVDPQSTSLRIKGHTHYPVSANSNYHTDPGINWDWPYYYSLLNDTNTPPPPPPLPPPPPPSEGNCLVNQSLSTPIQPNTYEASGSISASNTVSSGAVNFKSLVINLNNGFQVTGGVFYAENAGCSNNKIILPDLENLNLSVQPNPFSSHTNIIFSLSKEQPVTILVNDITGKLIYNVADKEYRTQGKQQITFNAGNLASGIYYVTMKTSNKSTTKKMILNN